MIYVTPLGSLGNTMRVLCSAYSLSSEHDVCIYWNRDAKAKSLPIDYHDIFENTPVDVVYNITEDVEYFSNSNSTALGMPVIHHTNLSELARIPPNNNVIINTWNVFYPSDKSIYKLFRFNKEYVDIAMNLIGVHDVVGVHIRRGDFVGLYTLSKTEAFVESMRAEISRNSNIKFFVATDDVDEENNLIKLFGDRIIIHPKQNGYDRSSNEFMRDGVVDVVALSMCSRILGSATSTFSTMASYIGGVPLYVQ